MKIKLLVLFILTLNISNAQSSDWLWAKSAGNNNDDLVKSVATDLAGNVYAVGSFSSDSIRFGAFNLINSGAGSYDMFIVKYDPSGNVLWARSFGGGDSDFGSAVATDELATDSEGNVYLGGSFRSTTITFDTITLTNSGPPFSDFCLVKFNADGHTLWASTSANSPSSDATYSICTDKAGNVYLTGPYQSDSITIGSTTLYNSGAPNLDCYIVKYNLSGTVLWAKGIGGNDDDAVKSISADGNENIFACGYFFSPTLKLGGTTLTNYSPGTSDLFIAKFDYAGNLLWAKREGGADSDDGSSIATDIQGNVYLGGSFRSDHITFDTVTLINSGPPYSDFCLVKFNPSGTVLWVNTSLNSPSSDATYSVCTDKAGNIYLSGPYQSDSISFGSTTLYNSNSPNLDFYIVKYSPTGNILWTKGLGSGNDEAANSICTDKNGNLFAGGYFFSPTLSFGGTTLLNTSSGTGDLFVAEISHNTGIKGNTRVQNNLIYPNPSSSQITIDLENRNSEVSSVEIYNVEGKIITGIQTRENNLTVNVSNYPSGVYIVKIKTNSLLSQGKFCKE